MDHLRFFLVSGLPATDTKPSRIKIKDLYNNKSIILNNQGEWPEYRALRHFRDAKIEITSDGSVQGGTIFGTPDFTTFL